MAAYRVVFIIFALALATVGTHASERYDVEATKQEAYDMYLNSVRLPGSTIYSGSNSAADLSDNFQVLSAYELVNDYINLLSMQQTIEIKRKLQTLERKNGTQIVILTVPSTGGLSAFEYGRGVFSKWDIGNNGDQNGVLLILSANRDMAIITGAGSDGALPDLECYRILQTIAQPRLKKEQYFEALNETVDAFIQDFKNENTKKTWYNYLVVDNFSKAMTFGEKLKHNSDKFIAVTFAFLGLLWFSYIIYASWRKGRRND